MIVRYLLSQKRTPLQTPLCHLLKIFSEGIIVLCLSRSCRSLIYSAMSPLQLQLSLIPILNCSNKLIPYRRPVNQLVH